MTIEQLKKYENKAKELKLLIEECVINIKFRNKVKENQRNLIKYTKEFKSIVKILSKAKKEALKDEI